LGGSGSWRLEDPVFGEVYVGRNEVIDKSPVLQKGMNPIKVANFRGMQRKPEYAAKKKWQRTAK